MAVYYSSTSCVKEECSRLLVAVFSKECSSLFTQPACWLYFHSISLNINNYWLKDSQKELFMSSTDSTKETICSYQINFHTAANSSCLVHQIDSIWLDKAIDYLCPMLKVAL